jgi:hypothetical protein
MWENRLRQVRCQGKRNSSREEWEFLICTTYFCNFWTSIKLSKNIPFFNVSFRLKGNYLLTAGNNLWLIINNNCIWILNLDGVLLKDKVKATLELTSAPRH